MTIIKLEELPKSLSEQFSFDGNKLKIKNPDALRKEFIDKLFFTFIFTEDEEIKNCLRWIIRESAILTGAIPSSIHTFYEAKSRGKYSHVTVPAINIRGLTYETARSIFRCAKKLASKTFLFEIAKSEIGYTKQSLSEYSTVILAAALKEGYRGPVFIQGDHFQINAKNFSQNPEKEVSGIKELIAEAIAADFYNIDIDASTVVDLSKNELEAQQHNNYEITAKLAQFIREKQPKQLDVSIGGEIGEVGGKNSTVQELVAFLGGFSKMFANLKPNAKGLSKISVQTGTTHGGFVLPDGSIAKVKLDFDALNALSAKAKEMGLAGAVQHGASTLPEEAFNRFPETDTAEIHLATGFQNIVYDSANLPVELKNRIIEYIHDTFISEKKEGETDEQFVYKTRKKAFGPFKKELYSLPENIKHAISMELQEKLELLFKKLNASNTEGFIAESVKTTVVPKEAPKRIEKLFHK